MSTPLFHSVPPALSTLYGTIDGHVKSGAPVFAGTPGSISVRSNQHGRQYYVHRYYDGAGTQREKYLGLVGEADEGVEALRGRINETKALLRDIRLLIREGFQAADSQTYATLAALHLHGLFQAGATLVGSHAFGILLNQMGVRAAAYATEDVDVARREELAFEKYPESSFLEMLRDSGIHFVEVPQLDIRKPSSSFKRQGKSRFHVDLLVPSRDASIGIAEVPELKAHATTLPFLAYLLGETTMATLLCSEGACPVRVPVAERFAIHKLVVSQLRTGRDAKSDKDIHQASVLLAVLGERFPGAVESAVAELPASALRYLKRAKPAVDEALAASPRALAEFEDALANIKL